MNRILTGLFLIGFLAMLAGKASASYTSVGLTERYSAPAVDSVPTNIVWRYNSARQMDYLVKPDGTIISNTYDAAGRLVTMKAMKEGISDEVAYSYDEAGRIGSVTRSGNIIQYSYDAFLLTGEQTLSGTISRGYDDDFRVTSLMLAGVMGVSYAYDDDGLLTQAGDVSLTRDPTTGFLTSTVLGNVSDQRIYNGFGEVANYTATISGNPMYSVSYGYDALGRITNQAETIDGSSVNKSYVYDNRGRIVRVAKDGPATEEYSYDANGNRLTANVNGNPVTGVYDNQDRLLSYGDISFTYSVNGEQTNRTVNGQTTTLAYDIFGQLSNITLSDGRTISYDKDALGRITAKRIDGSVVKGWIYKDGLKPIAETDAFGNIVSVFVYGSSPLTPDYMTRDGSNYRLVRDHVGSVRLVIDMATGTIAQRLDYDSFGNILQDTAPGFQPFGFQSGLYDDDTSFVQFGARWYDPLTGRWLSKDSLLLAAGWNIYAFCNNNPIALIDPWGLFTRDELIVIRNAALRSHQSALNDAIEAQNTLTQIAYARAGSTTALAASFAGTAGEIALVGIPVLGISGLGSSTAAIGGPATLALPIGNMGATVSIGTGSIIPSSYLLSGWTALAIGVSRTSTEFWNWMRMRGRADAAQQALDSAVAAMQATMNVARAAQALIDK